MSESSYASDEEIDDGSPSFSGAKDAVVSRFRLLVSKRFQKAYLGILLFMSTALFMIGVSAVSYWIFYYKFIPQVELQRPVHLQFGDGHPWGTAPLGTELTTLQPYDVTVRLELPRTPSNLAAGNFMLDLTLFSHPSTSAKTGRNTSTDVIAQSRRPAILTYASSMVDTASKLTFMPFYLTGWRREAETLEVHMMEQIEFPRGWRNLPETLRLEIHSDERMQIYEAKVEFKATFTGLRWFVYNWRISSFLIFGFMFWCMSMASTSIVWIILAYSFGSSDGDQETKIKQETRSDTLVKEESDDESVDISKFPSSSSHGPPSKKIKTEHDSEEDVNPEPSTTSEAEETDNGSPADEAGDSAGHGGAGTGLESAEDRGIQRRRSRIFKEEEGDS